MARTPKQSKYYVRVARLRIETAILEVDAVNDDEAERKAVQKAMQMPTRAWVAERFDPSVYRPHVETMVTGDDFAPPVRLDQDQALEELAEVDTRYLLLKASSDIDEGGLVLQPWFVTDRPDLLASDITRDWIGSLQQLGVTHLSERLDDLAAGSPPQPSDRILFSAPGPRKRGNKQD